MGQQKPDGSTGGYDKIELPATDGGQPAPPTQGGSEGGSTPPAGTIERPAGLPASNHFMSRDRALLESEYRYLFSKCEIVERWKRELRVTCDWIVQNKDAFLSVQDATRVPWFVVAVINVLEGGLDLDGTLLNGDPWNKKTVHYPPGRGPWPSWKAAAIEALHTEAVGWHFDLTTWKWSDVGAVFFFLEAWNGFNARTEPQYSGTTPHGASPYIYSGTPFYQKGKKLENPTRFDKDLASEQLGCMAILFELKQRGAISI